MNADTVTPSVYLGCYGVIVYSGCVTCCRSWQRSRQHTCSSLKKKKDSLATSTVVVVAVTDVVEVVAVVEVVQIVEVVEIEGIKVDQRKRRRTHYTNYHRQQQLLQSKHYKDKTSLISSEPTEPLPGNKTLRDNSTSRTQYQRF